MNNLIRAQSVPCNGCTACCQNDAIILHPECGDDASQYLTETTIHPLTGAPALMLQKRSDGACIYLGDRGCTIHGRAPAICREFDCRRFFVKLGAAAAKRAVESGLASQTVIDASRKRRHTLPTERRRS